MAITIEDFRTKALEGGILREDQNRPGQLKARNPFLNKIVVFLRNIIGLGVKTTAENQVVTYSFYAALRKEYGNIATNMLTNLEARMNAGLPLRSRLVTLAVDNLENQRNNITVRNNRRAAHYFTDPGFRPVWTRVCRNRGLGTRFDDTLGNLYTDEGEQLRGKIGRAIIEFGQTQGRVVTRQEAENITENMIDNAFNPIQ